MAGTVVAGTMSDGTNSGSTTDMIKGSARAWVNFNGTGTVAIRASYNVSSITDNGTGLYTVNYTDAMPDINYSLGGMCSSTVADHNNYILGQGTADANTVSGSTIRIINGGSTVEYDVDRVYIQVFR